MTVTYTVAATKDMSRRFASYFGEELAERLEFRTINGICAKIIQYYSRSVGKSAFELVKDAKDHPSFSDRNLSGNRTQLSNRK